MDGQSEETDNSHGVYFHQNSSGTWIPSACFVDSEATVVDECIRTGPMKYLFKGGCVTGYEDASNCYARGKFKVGKELREETLLNLRRTIEQIDILNIIQTFGARSGGTGSGFCSHLFEALGDIYPHVEFDGHCVFPSQRGQDTVTEAYNTVFACSEFDDIFAIEYIYDNQGLQECVSQAFGSDAEISYADLNHLIGLVPSTLSACARWGPGSSQKSIGINLVPFRGISTVAPAILPLLHDTSPRIVTEHSLLAEAFLNRCEMAKIDTFAGQYISSVLLYRGSPRIPTNYHKMIRERVDFVPWVSTGIKYEVCARKFTLNYSDTPTSKRYLEAPIGLAKLCNHTNITDDILTPLIGRFNALLEQRAYVHWYVREGMEEGEFSEAVEKLETAISNVQAILSKASNE